MTDFLIPLALTFAALIVVALLLLHAMLTGMEAGARAMARETREYLERLTDEVGA